jgi:ankyrin repeat protein
MDPLSMSASIIAVLQLTEEVVKYITSAVGATKERKRLRDELRACRNTLQDIKDEADDSEEGKDWTKTVEALEAPGGPLGRLWAALCKIESKLKPKKGIGKALANLAWPFTEKEIKEIYATIEREKSLLALAMENNSRKLIQEIKRTSGENTRHLIELLGTLRLSSEKSERAFSELKDGLANIQDSHVGLHDSMNGLQQRQDLRDADRERSIILDWLTPIDYYAQQSDFINRRQTGTGKWLLDSAEFQAWLHADKQTLFCPGIPGSGKTILTSIVIEDLEARRGKNESIGVAYIYCNFRQTNEQKAGDLLASLLKQLSRDRPSLPESVSALYSKHKEKRSRPSIGEISDALQSVAALSKTFLIVDALDECQVTDGCRSMFLSEIFKVQSNSRANVFATSRFIPDIMEQFRGATALEIRADPEDVRRYVDAHISDLPSFVGRNPELKEEIVTEIARVVDGMYVSSGQSCRKHTNVCRFLLAQLHLGSLKGKRSPKAVRAALAKLPSGSEAYDDAYRSAMDRIEAQAEDQEQLAKQALSWITCAQRPLSTIELQHALAVEDGETKLDEENLSQLEDIVSVCAGLVTIDEESSVIRLVHYTTQEYFERTQIHWFPDAESEITTTCVTYLSFEVFKSGLCKTDAAFEARLDTSPLYNYSAHYWGQHARKGTTLAKEVITFLQSHEAVEACSQAMLAEKTGPRDPAYSQLVPRRMTGLHLAAYAGIETALKALLDKKVKTDARNDYGRTPLSYAAAEGHEAVIQLLLATGNVDADAKDEDGRTPLSYAAADGHEAVVQLLLATGKIDADAKDEDGRTPLLYAAADGHEAVVQLLLATGKVDADAKDEDGRTPLSYAAADGHEAVVQLLLATGKVDADSKNITNGWTPLLYAAAYGHDAIVQLLLATGKVDADSKNITNGWTPLLYAAADGHEAVVQLLLATGKVDANSKDENGRTPLLYAAARGHEAVVQLLLATGKVNVDAKDIYGQTALSYAAADGHEAVVQLLMT